MRDSDEEDVLTKLNTDLNKSMTFLEDTTNTPQQERCASKSVKISTVASTVATSSVKKSPTRKSILKKSGTGRNEVDDSDVERNCIMPVGGTANRKGGTTQRPRSLSDLRRDEALKADSTDSTFSLDDLSPNEEIWIMDIPRTIDPRLLEGQNLTFGAKGKLKVGEERYCVVSKAIASTLTCVVSTGDKGNSYKAVNVKPAGLITVRRKLSNTSRSKPKRVGNTAVPFPKNLRVRHPLFGAAYKDKVLLMKVES